MDRRAFMNLAAAGGGVVFSQGLAGCAGMRHDASAADHFFVQLTDTHWGYRGAANPMSQDTLPEAIAAVNALPREPQFVIFTGDLTHTTDDPQERRSRLAAFKSMASQLNCKRVHFMPGEHDAALDRGQAYREYFGETNYHFEFGGVQYIALDNACDPGAKLGEVQLQWLSGHLSSLDKAQPIVVFAHRPLFDLAPKWDWATRDGAQALELLMPFTNVTVFYGHIHQEHRYMSGHIAHHSAKSLIFPLTAPGSQPNRAPLPWNPAAPYSGLGWHEVALAKAGRHVDVKGKPLRSA